MSIVRGYELPVEFPEKVLHQAENAAHDVTEADMQAEQICEMYRW